MGLVLSIDAGTTNLKAALVDEEGRLVGAAQQVEMAIETDASGRAEHDPARLIATLLDVCRRAVAERGRDIDLVALTSYQFGLVLADHDGRPLTGISTFADTTAQANLPRFLDATGDAGLRYRQTGCPPIFQYPVNRLHWLAAVNPALAGRTFRVLDSKSFLMHALAGESCTDFSTANSLGCLNVDGTWNDEIIAATGFRVEQFPRVVDGFAQRLPLRAGICDELGLRRGTPIGVGLYDGAALAAALSGFEPGVAVGNFGTSGMFRIPATAPVPDPEGMLVNSCPLRRGLYFCGSGINNCTIATNWLLKIFEEPVDYLRGAALSNPGANGVMTFPYFTGERDRVIGNIGTGVVLGLGLNTTRADLARSFLEGVAFSYLLVKRALDSSFPATELRLGGGGSSNSNWMQVIADVLDLPVRVTGHPEMGIVGAAGIARHRDMAALRAASDRIMADAVRIEPRPAVTAVYRELAQRYFAVRATLAAPLRAHLPPPS